MKRFTLLFIVSLFINGVFGDEVKSVSVMKGDSLTLHTDITDIQNNDLLDWRFGEKEDRIAQINRAANLISVYAGSELRFRDRLQVNHQTGDLTIRNIITQHTGDYQLDFTRVTPTRKKFSVSVVGAGGGKSVSVMEEDSVTLLTDDLDIQKYDVIRWRFRHENSPLVELNRNTAIFFIYDDVHDGRFKDRLQVNDQTGDLTITNITTQHTGLYEVDLSNSSGGYTIHQSFTVTVSGKVMTVSVIKGESVTLKTNTEIQSYDLIQWMFVPDDDTRIAEIYKPDNTFAVYDDVLDGRFRDRLILNNQTGDLTITNITTQHTGLYELKMSSSRRSIQRRFSVNVSVLSSYVIFGLCVVGVLVIVALTAAGVFYYHYRCPKAIIRTVMEGQSVRLKTDVDNIKTDDVIEWRFKTGLFQKTIIGKIKKTKMTTGGDERFSNNVQLIESTGSLLITNITTDRSGLYELKVTSGGITSYKRFRVIDFNRTKWAMTSWFWSWKRPASQYEL